MKNTASVIWTGVVKMKLKNIVASITLEQSTEIRFTTSPVVYSFLIFQIIQTAT